ncbi:tRNA guanosine(34) transglycosylase Tgt [Candidatus Wolfebacteria bacterium]|nr:tRNA guanosine(34) transglycosylase Tgt [Candidatus Wolfebacteria bacterium]
MEFKILKKSKKSRARLGILKTPHGEIETPSLVPVATQATIKTLSSDEVLKTKSQILISNTFHLHLKPGEKIVKSAGGLHKFMNWNKPLMTDSGGYQVFSLGFGKDYGTGKIMKGGRVNNFSPKRIAIEIGQQPRSIKITNDGVYFNSPIDGKKIFIGPKESIKIQESLGADIIFAFDECTSPMADYEYTKKSLLKTHKWTKICLESQRTSQSLFGIVQGGKFKDLRIESSKFIASLPFGGFGIGGEFGDNKKIMTKMIDWVINELPDAKPRHLLGIGHMEDIPEIIKSGVDLFDCTLPTHYGRRGIAFTSASRLNLNKSIFLKEKKVLDKKCGCDVCKNYKRNYISHLLRAKEITGMKLLTFHNLYFFNSYVKRIREGIKRGNM